MRKPRAYGLVFMLWACAVAFDGSRVYVSGQDMGLMPQIIESARATHEGSPIVVDPVSVSKFAAALGRAATSAEVLTGLDNVTTDTTVIATVCPKRRPCHFRNNPLRVHIVTIAFPTPNEATVEIMLTFNRRTTHGDLFKSSTLLRVLYVKDGRWKEVSRTVLSEF